MEEKMSQKEFSKKLVELYAEKTGCGIQHEGSPCNICFHAIEADHRHINWCVLLALRGDYDPKSLLKDIAKELKIKGGK